MIVYRVGDSYFFNVHLALHEVMKTGKPVSFYCKDDEYDKLDWTKEPEHSLDELMTASILDLRHRYERIIFGWSGGTDSHTMYRIFKQNNIHIDEILVKASKHLGQYPEENFIWINKNHYDKETIITRYDQNDTFLRGMDCPDENWVYKNKGDLLMFGMSTAAEGVKHLIEKNHAGKKWIYIAGFEKPQIIYKNGKWYATQIDDPLRQTMGYDHVHCFFLDPLINLKQSHLLKKNVKEHINKNKLTLNDGDSAHDKYQWIIKEGYRQLALACGRDPELTHGTSHLQKIETLRYRMLHVDGEKHYKDILRNTDPTLKAYLGNQDKTALNFVKGVFNLSSEKRYVEFLNNGKYLKMKNHVLHVQGIWSKPYDIGY